MDSFEMPPGRMEELEWICDRLMESVVALEATNKLQTERLDIAFDHINSLSRRVDRLLYVVDKLHRGEKVEIGETERPARDSWHEKWGWDESG